MPKVTINNKNGLTQTAGSGLTVDTSSTFQQKATLNGGLVKKREAIARTDLGGTALYRIELSGSQSGRTWVLGDNGRGSPWYVHIPTGSVGWTARFMLTGSLRASSNVVITGSVGDGGGSVTPGMTGRITALNDVTTLTAAGGITAQNAAGSAATGGTLQSITFVAGTAVAGDMVDVEVVSAGVVRFTGIAST